MLCKLSSGSLARGDVWHGGKTLNPWDLDQGSSGSSAGSAITAINFASGASITDVSAGISTILEFTAEDVSSASNLVRIGIGSTSAIRQVLMSHNGEDAFVLEYPYVSIGAEQHDESWSGIGTFYSQLKGTDFELVFVPDAKFVGTSCQIQVYSEVINSGFDLINIEFPLEYKLQFVTFSSSRKFLLNSPTTPINKSLS